jgi:hypothetical protein
MPGMSEREVEALAEARRARDAYARDDETGGKRMVPIKLADLESLIEAAQRGLRADEVAVALKELFKAGEEVGGLVGRTWEEAMQRASEVIEAYGKQPQTTEAPEPAI